MNYTGNQLGCEIRGNFLIIYNIERPEQVNTKVYVCFSPQLFFS